MSIPEDIDAKVHAANLALDARAALSTTTTTADASMEREKFEAWAQKEWDSFEPHDYQLQIGGVFKGEYVNLQLEDLWGAWQARAAISETNASTERIPTAQEVKDWMRTPEGRKALGLPEHDPQVTITTTHGHIDSAGRTWIGLETTTGDHASALAPQEAAEPTREDGVGFETWASDEGLFLGSYDTQAGANYIDAETQGAWRGWHAALATPRTEAAAVAPDAVQGEFVMVSLSLWHDIRSLQDGTKADWISQNAWSDWDQSVIDRSVEISLARQLRVARDGPVQPKADFRWFRKVLREAGVWPDDEAPLDMIGPVAGYWEAMLRAGLPRIEATTTSKDPAAPSNVREQVPVAYGAFDADSDRCYIAAAITESVRRWIGLDDRYHVEPLFRALKSATPDAGKGETT